MTATQPIDFFWTKNLDILDDPKVNITFHNLLSMSNEAITEWVNYTRKRIVEVWDTKGIPPLNGRDRPELIEHFAQMTGESVRKFQRKDDLDGESNVILNTSVLGSACNQFFPTMMKAKINYNTSVKNGDKFNGYSVYDLFKEDRFIKRMQTGFRRHFRRDSFYRYSISIPAGSADGIVPARTGLDWIKAFNSMPHMFKGYNFWLNEVETTEGKGSGYTQTDAGKFLTINGNELLELYKSGQLKKENFSNIKMDKTSAKVPNKIFAIRFYETDKKIFPLGFTAFKIGYIQVAVNFPPMIAKFLYEKYTDKIKTQKVINVYDPSSGWGGRILGAMALNSDRHINYIGTDPNTDNSLPEIGITRYEYLASFFNDNTISEAHRMFGMKRVNTFEVFQHGSEEIHKDPKFQKYKGQLDFIFTSPPYFNREGYSDDEEQSLKKFPQYEAWRKGFLEQTLATCVEYLKPKRYLLWNIADIKVGSLYYPLEQDSKDILKKLGMEFKGIEKMCLMNMPGANRIGDDGKPTAKNFCKVDGKWRKYEPIFVFYKP